MTNLQNMNSILFSIGDLKRTSGSQLRDRFMFRFDELATENISQNEFLNPQEEFYI